MHTPPPEPLPRRVGADEYTSDENARLVGGFGKTVVTLKGQWGTRYRINVEKVEDGEMTTRTIATGAFYPERHSDEAVYELATGVTIVVEMIPGNATDFEPDVSERHVTTGVPIFVHQMEPVLPVDSASEWNGYLDREGEKKLRDRLDAASESPDLPDGTILRYVASKSSHGVTLSIEQFIEWGVLTLQDISGSPLPHFQKALQEISGSGLDEDLDARHEDDLARHAEYKASKLYSTDPAPDGYARPVAIIFLPIAVETASRLAAVFERDSTIRNIVADFPVDSDPLGLKVRSSAWLVEAPPETT